MKECSSTYFTFPTDDDFDSLSFPSLGGERVRISQKFSLFPLFDYFNFARGGGVHGGKEEKEMRGNHATLRSGAKGFFILINDLC